MLNQGERPSRKALIIATGKYSDPQLGNLPSPQADADALEEVLENAGRFERVRVLLDETTQNIRIQLLDFFAEAEFQDLLLVYFSCHGLRDADAAGTLYFAGADTRVDAIAATALDSRYVTERIDLSRSRRTVLVLDCCNAGAFHRGLRARGPADLTFYPEELSGRGRLVITSATAVQQAFEPDSELERPDPSVFTGSLVRGIQSGAADNNGDGVISVLEAFRFVEDDLRASRAKQTPRFHGEEIEGDLPLAWLPRPVTPPPLVSTRVTSWFTTAVFYQLYVRSFFDSNDDGVGDLRGLIRKLDYLEWLGIDALILVGLLRSPWRDGGFDVTDFTSVAPEIGDLRDMEELLAEAHERNIRIVIELPLNHTSDQHPWFQASRRDPSGPFGDYFVWSESNNRYQEARILLPDRETSNWAYDSERGQFYWHRFHAHEPDLNFDNPAVHESILEALRFWLDMEIDGFLLGAVPYLYERDGTACENLLETHLFVKRIRSLVEEARPDAVLLLGANQQPNDVVEYFGDPARGGDECHLAFHFPIMPKLFMAVNKESRLPVTDTLVQVPDVPATCQWAMLLRNHEELSLDLLTDDERDFMFATLVRDPMSRARRGVGRRLATLMDNDRDQLQLLAALILSLPGSPVLYYGDEIGMGDNIYLDDRDGLRTPMQWTPDRNAGFSHSEPGQLHLPVNADAVYGYQTVNVESQLRGQASLLHWVHQLLAIRRLHPTLSAGSFTELGGTNLSVLTYARETDDGVILCFNNFSRFPQATQVDLRPWERRNPREVSGGTPFPPIGSEAYRVTLARYGYLWLSVE